MALGSCSSAIDWASWLSARSGRVIERLTRQATNAAAITAASPTPMYQRRRASASDRRSSARRSSTSAT